MVIAFLETLLLARNEPTTQEEKEYMIVIGKHLATNEKFPTREAAENRINSIDWNLISAMIYACKEADEYEKKLKRTTKRLKFLNTESTCNCY